MTDRPFALAISCVDGRVHRSLLAWIGDTLSLERVDYLTVPGADAALAEAGDEYDRARRLAGFLAERRHHECAIVAGHWDCQGNPVAEARHREQIRAAAERVHGWDLSPRTLGVWVADDGQVSVVEEFP